MFVDVVVVILVLVIPASPWRVNLEDLSLLPSRAGPWVTLAPEWVLQMSQCGAGRDEEGRARQNLRDPPQTAGTNLL